MSRKTHTFDSRAQEKWAFRDKAAVGSPLG